MLLVINYFSYYSFTILLPFTLLVIVVHIHCSYIVHLLLWLLFIVNILVTIHNIIHVIDHMHENPFGHLSSVLIIT